ncbi:MAG TPA: diaminopimelate epimerase [Stellaceae bacterium]|jgi:diaminopimelate epimerase|nr:diaminopimelate epimerase [Stellaceae bacterium]
MARIPFRKMHGLGNDFVVLDRRQGGVAIDAAGASALGDRHRGIGFDQLIVIEKPRDPAARALVRFLNSDGSEAGACGNGTRCVASLLAAEDGAREMQLETVSGLLAAEMLADGRVAVDMGVPRTEWRDIPLAREMDTLHVELTAGPLADPVCTNMGNPHATFFVADAEAVDIEGLGPGLEHDALFPERANIGVASIAGGGAIRLRVWERGAGLTLACGSGACAALVAAARRGLTGRSAAVIVDGGRLEIAWREDGHVVMTGPAATSFEGSFDAELLGGL